MQGSVQLVHTGQQERRQVSYSRTTSPHDTGGGNAWPSSDAVPVAGPAGANADACQLWVT